MMESFQNLQAYQIILASQSPRRKELLEKLGLPFAVMKAVDVEESFPMGLKGREIVEFLAKKKADAFPLQKEQLVITADTIVWMDDALFGKPSDKEHAKQMLRRLSGRTHEVFTGVGLTAETKQVLFSARSEVTFAQLDAEEIDYYVDEFLPLDKAGSYGIQEWIGFIGIESISGSFWNVMGLPLQKLYQALKSF